MNFSSWLTDSKSMLGNSILCFLSRVFSFFFKYSFSVDGGVSVQFSFTILNLYLIYIYIYIYFVTIVFVSPSIHPADKIVMHGYYTCIIFVYICNEKFKVSQLFFLFIGLKKKKWNFVRVSVSLLCMFVYVCVCVYMMCVRNQVRKFSFFVHIIISKNISNT